MLEAQFPVAKELIEGDEPSWTDDAGLSDSAERYMEIAVEGARRALPAPQAAAPASVLGPESGDALSDARAAVESRGQPPLVRRRRSGASPSSAPSAVGASEFTDGSHDTQEMPTVLDMEPSRESPFARAAAVWDNRPADMTPAQDGHARLTFHARILARLTGGQRARFVPGLKLGQPAPSGASPAGAASRAAPQQRPTPSKRGGASIQHLPPGALAASLVLAAEGLGKFRKRRALGLKHGMLDILLAADTLQTRAAASAATRSGPWSSTEAMTDAAPAVPTQRILQPSIDATQHPAVHEAQQMRHAMRQSDAMAVVTTVIKSGKRSAEGPGPLVTARAQLGALGDLSRRRIAGLHWMPPTSYPIDRRLRRKAYLDELRRIYYQELPLAGLRPDIVTLNTMVKAYCAAGQSKLAHAFVADEFPLYGCSPDARTFRSLLRLHIAKRDGSGAEEVFTTMLRLGVTPDQDCFGMLVHLRAREWRLKDAVMTLREMKERGLSCPEHYARLLRQRCKEKGIMHPLVPEHPVGWQFRPEVMKKRRSFGRVINKLVSGALRQKINGMR